MASDFQVRDGSYEAQSRTKVNKAYIYIEQNLVE